MRKENFKINGYEAPVLEMLDMVVEQGLATSGGATAEDGVVDNWGDY